MTSASAAAEAQIKSEIERLTGKFTPSYHILANVDGFSSLATINQHKAHQKNKPWQTGANYYAPYPQGGPPGRSNTYINPSYKPTNKYIRPGLNVAGPSKTTVTPTPTAPSVTSSTPAASTPTTGSSTVPSPVLSSSKPVSTVGGPIKEVVLGGVAFESSRRVLVRKDRESHFHPCSFACCVFLMCT